MHLAVDIINGKYDLDLPLAKEEGLPNLGGAKLELVFADTKGEPKNGLAEVERLITQEKGVAIIGAYQSSVTKTASQATERLTGRPALCSQQEQEAGRDHQLRGQGECFCSRQVNLKRWQRDGRCPGQGQDERCRLPEQILAMSEGGQLHLREVTEIASALADIKPFINQ